MSYNALEKSLIFFDAALALVHLGEF